MSTSPKLHHARLWIACILIVLPLLVATTTPAAEPVVPVPEPFTQPTEIPGKFALDNVRFPPVPDPKVGAKPDGLPDDAVSPLYGIYMWMGEYRRFRESIKSIGWKSIRMGGNIDEDAVRLLAGDGMDILHTMGPGALRSRDPAEREKILAEYIASMESFAKRYGPGGEFFKANPTLAAHPIRFIGICNEPNFQYVIPPDDRPNAEVEADREALYAALLPRAFEALKKANPEVQVVGFQAGGASAGDRRFIANMLKINPKLFDFCDVGANHPYLDPDPPEAWAIRSWGRYDIADGVSTWKKWFADGGKPDMPLWLTEIGWEVSTPEGGRYQKPPEHGITQALQAAYITRLYSLASRWGVERVFIMFITDTDTYNGGFLSFFDGSERLSAKAVRNHIKLMPWPQLKKVIREIEDGTYAYQFATGREDEEIIMTWRVAGPGEISLDIPWANAELVDMFGNVKAITGGEAVKVGIGPLPVYIRATTQTQ